MKWVYSVFCVFGTILPWSQLGPWLLQHGLSIPLLIQDAFGQRISAFAWLDVIVSAVVVLIFITVEGRRERVRHLWAPFVAMFTVGVSLALPLFLLLREIRIEQRANNRLNANTGKPGAD